MYHINQNEFDIRSQNMLQITVDQDEINYFGSKYTIKQKSINLTKIMNFEYNCLFFNGCVELKHFDTNNSFYKEFLAENINNPEQMGYEMESIGPKTIVNDTQKIVSYFKKLLNIDEIWHV